MVTAKPRSQHTVLDRYSPVMALIETGCQVMDYTAWKLEEGGEISKLPKSPVSYSAQWRTSTAYLSRLRISQTPFFCQTYWFSGAKAAVRTSDSSTVVSISLLRSLGRFILPKSYSTASQGAQNHAGVLKFRCSHHFVGRCLGSLRGSRT